MIMPLIIPTVNNVCYFFACVCCFLPMLSIEPICRTLRTSPAASTTKCTVCVALTRTTCRPMGSLSTTQLHMKSSAFIPPLSLIPLSTSPPCTPATTPIPLSLFRAKARISMKPSQLVPLRRACNNIIPHTVQHSTFSHLWSAFSHPQAENWRSYTHTHTAQYCLPECIHMSCMSVQLTQLMFQVSEPKRPKCGACKMYTLLLWYYNQHFI